MRAFDRPIGQYGYLNFGRLNNVDFVINAIPQFPPRRAIPSQNSIASDILSCFAALRYRKLTEAGKVAEWSNALDSKSSVRLWRTVGSNPTLSAIHSFSAEQVGCSRFPYRLNANRVLHRIVFSSKYEVATEFVPK